MFPAVFAIFIHFSGDRACIKDSVFIDPCCGSGGAALVQSKQGGINRINVYGQEKEAATYRLAKMNLALRGISHNLGETNDSSFTHDLHKGLYFVAIILTPVLMSILSSENAQRVNQSKTYFTLDLLIGCYILQQEIQKTSRTDIQRMKIGITQTFPQWVKIIYNPPFNLKGWYDSNLKDDPRWADYETPPESNANYAWMEI